MKKSVDVRQSVMKKVVSYERRRTREWLAQFFSGMFVLLAILAVVMWIVARDIVERQLLDLLSLFFEDQEIIADFWRDTLTVFWEELPQRWIVVGIVILGVLVCVWFVTRKKRQLIGKIQKELASYDKTR